MAYRLEMEGQSVRVSESLLIVHNNTRQVAGWLRVVCVWLRVVYVRLCVAVAVSVID